MLVLKYVYSLALVLQPNDALVYKLRADVRGHLGKTDQAMQDYRTAVELQEALEGWDEPTPY